MARKKLVHAGPVPVGAVRFRTMEWIESLDIPAPQASILLYLAHRLDQKYICSPGCPRIASAVKLHRNTVIRALQGLERSGYLSVKRSRSRRGNVYYRQVEVHVPSEYRPSSKDVGPGPVLGVSNNAMPTPPKVSTRAVCRNSQRIDRKYSAENKLEGRFTDTTLPGSVDNPRKNILRESRRSIPSRIRGEKNAESADDVPGSSDDSRFYVVGEDDRAALAALVWWEISGKKVGQRPIYESRRVNGKQVVAPVTRRMNHLIKTSYLAAKYFDGCRKTARARVAYWHRIGRLFFPDLPQFKEDHRFSHWDSDNLNSLWRKIGPCAVYVIAWTMANWESLSGEDKKNYQFLYSLSDLADHLTTKWVAAVRPVLAMNTAESKQLHRKLKIRR